MEEEFWKKREEIMARFMAAKSRKRERLVMMEKSLKEEFKKLTGQEAKNFEVW